MLTSKIRSLELEHGISPEPKYNCPNIDVVLAGLGEIRSNLVALCRTHQLEEDVGDVIDSTLDIIRDLEPIMENIRTVSSDLRDYAAEWRDIVSRC